ncbi:FYN-binding protein 1-like [Triticum dicoccoides]|uniref:FYN-binding protein 1-like n=1 Tax=Triticum dicoccoides TaxID=85692 RepID=UPI0018905FE7|nr:FYN-binding protein 1-like [Triticum dicoccoides]
MEPPSPSCFSKRPSYKDIAGDRAKPCEDDSSALSPILPTPSSAPAPPPPSKGIAGDQAEPCVAAPSPIPVMASSAPAPPPPPILRQDLMEVTMGDVDDQMVLTIDKQAEKWEAMEQEQHVWNAIDEERKLERQKEKRRHKERKKILEEKRKEKREEKRSKSDKITIGKVTGGEHVEIFPWSSSKSCSLKKGQVSLNEDCKFPIGGEGKFVREITIYLRIPFSSDYSIWRLKN